jgi:sugar phosphate isomerase/epimerase
MATELPFGLSTCWHGPGHASLAEAFAEARALGFRRVELYAHYTPREVERAGALAQAQGVEITSLHSPCPVPVDAAGARVACGDWLAATEEARRERAVDAVRRTIDAAARLGAWAIVVHLGGVELQSRQEALFAAIRAHGFGSPQHRELLEQAERERARLAGPHLEAASRSARALGEHARGTGVRLGLENRDLYWQIPRLDEYPTIFQACAGLPVGYWHDVGHGQKLENGGFGAHATYLQRYGDRLVGLHLHDIQLEHDHLAPGQGQIAYAWLAPYARPDVIQTVELSPRVPVEQVPGALKALSAAGFGAPARSAP